MTQTTRCWPGAHRTAWSPCPLVLPRWVQLSALLVAASPCYGKVWSKEHFTLIEGHSNEKEH